MTYQEFLGKLRETPQTWEVHPSCDGELHIRNGECCPITAVYDAELEAAFVSFAADRLGLSEQDERNIVYAADGASWSRYYNAAVRRDLLDACGLTERAS